MDYILETSQLTKQYGSYKAVNNVNLHIKEGSIYGFIGRNGAGKTTFLKMICGMASPTSGTIKLFGTEKNNIGTQMNKVGVLIEAPGLYPSMTAFDNMRLKYICSGMAKPDKNEYINSLLKLVGLDSVGNKKAGCFSLGMKQRLGIAMALVGDPKLLLLDEPINGLDPQGIAEVRDTIIKLNKERNITIIISSHILEELSKIATDYGIIDKGVLIKELTGQQLADSCQERLVISADNASEAESVIKDMGFQKYSVIGGNTIEIYERYNETPELIFALADKKVRINSISPKNESIENYFIRITGGNTNA
jgi:ABC-2 type transport system ATP-binding protein